MYNETNNTSKRISFQSIFSSLCTLYQRTTPDDSLIADLEATAHDINKRLHEKYPFVESELPSQKVMNQQAKTTDGSGKVKICPVPGCGKPMVRQFNKKNAKAPDWKCSNKNCKFKKLIGGGWAKSDFITGVWDEKEEDINCAKNEDDITDEANKQVFDEYGNPI
jgi:hypothetical protein